MKYVIVGAGPSGVIAAILLKKKNINNDVVILEQLDKPLKKLSATGNGKCNFANTTPLDSTIYSNEKALVNIVEYDYKKQLELLHSLNIVEKANGELLYPITESAQSIINALLNACNQLDIKILTSNKVLDYYKYNNKYLIETDTIKIEADKIIIATGGKSSPKLGSDGSLFTTLEKHGYQIKTMYPGLCPIRTIEKTKILDGTRVKAKVTIKDKNNIIYEENGEVLFKEHGLSGIVIFNIASIIARFEKKYLNLEIDILPLIGEATLEQFLKEKGRKIFVNAFLHPNMIKYLENIKDDHLVHFIKHMPFTFNDFYGFAFSQVTVGGLSFDNVDSNYESKIEPNVYFIGEILDNDGLCGGYNLMWAIGSAMKVIDNIEK